MNWWRENFSWIKYILGIIWTVFVFGVSSYVSFRETKSEIKLVDEKISLMIKVMDNIIKDNEQFKNYILFKENK